MADLLHVLRSEDALPLADAFERTRYIKEPRNSFVERVNRTFSSFRGHRSDILEAKKLDYAQLWDHTAHQSHGCGPESGYNTFCDRGIALRIGNGIGI